VKDGHWRLFTSTRRENNKTAVSGGDQSVLCTPRVFKTDKQIENSVVTYESRSAIRFLSVRNTKPAIVEFVKFAEKMRLEDGRDFKKTTSRNTENKRRGIVFIHDNGRPHTANVTQQLLMDFGQLSYSPDLAPPSDFRLFFFYTRNRSLVARALMKMTR